MHVTIANAIWTQVGQESRLQVVLFPFLNLPGGIVFGGRVGAGGLFSKRKYKKQYFLRHWFGYCRFLG